MKQAETSKTLQTEGKKQGIKSIERVFPKEMTSNEIKNEISEIKL